MRTRLGLTGATALALLVSTLVAAQPAHAGKPESPGLRVDGTRIVEANGADFVMRGVSHPHVWYPDRTGAFAGIKSYGTNTVRVVLSGGRWTPVNDVEDVRNVVSLCKANKLICVLENHDTTGFGEQEGSVSLDTAADYWLSVQDALVGEEDHIVVNIGNEPIGNVPVTPGWAEATSAAINKLRGAGFEHLIMVDAPNWGQDWQFGMRDNARTVFESDPHRNTVFSVHMYGVFDTGAEVVAYLDAFRTAGLPLVIGEFGFDHSDGDPDEDTIMAEAQARGVGYIGWSWSGNGGGVEYLDMVDGFDATSLTPWGERIFNGPNGITATSEEATIYAAPSCSVTAEAGDRSRDGYAVRPVTVTNTGARASTWKVTFTLPAGQRIVRAWGAKVTARGTAVTAVTAVGEWRDRTLEAGESTAFGFKVKRHRGHATPSGYTCTAA